MRSPGRAPDFRITLPFGTVLTTTISARIPLGDSAVLPPARVTLYLSARPTTLRMKRFTQFCGKALGNAIERNAAIGSPPLRQCRSVPASDSDDQPTRGVPVTAKVDSIQAEVGRDEGVVFRSSATTRTARKSQHGAVVPNSSQNGRIFRSSDHPPDLSNQRFFGNRHGNYYKRGSCCAGRCPLACDA